MNEMRVCHLHSAYSAHSIYACLIQMEIRLKSNFILYFVCFFFFFNIYFCIKCVLGSPEMAFINAMAAAAATSFIARACRDGQISTCGCSRSLRPRELHSDWTWGGCGDDLDFGYRFIALIVA